MSNFVGVKNQFDFIYGVDELSERLKREALILDKIAVPYWTGVVESIRHQVPDSFIADLDWLYDQGVIYDPKIPVVPPGSLSKEYHQYIDLAVLYSDRIETSFNKDSDVTLLDIVALTRYQNQLKTRADCLYLREVKNIDACWSFSEFTLPDMGSNREVMAIVLKNMPYPDESVAWQDILHFGRTLIRDRNSLD